MHLIDLIKKTFTGFQVILFFNLMGKIASSVTFSYSTFSQVASLQRDTEKCTIHTHTTHSLLIFPLYIVFFDYICYSGSPG